jgi:hypothetical protein
MKRIFKYTMLVASFSLLAFSCKKPDEEIVPKTDGEILGEYIIKKFASNYYDGIEVYRNGGLIAIDFDFKIDKQFLIFPDNNGNYYKFDLNKSIYHVESKDFIIIYF